MAWRALAVLLLATSTTRAEESAVAAAVRWYLALADEGDQEPPPASLPDVVAPTKQGAEDANSQLDAAKVRPPGLIDFRTLSKNWDRLNRRLSNAGLSFGLAYTVLFQGASESLGEDHAASGDVDLFGRWIAVGRDSDNPGGLVAYAEQRHRFTTIAPSRLGEEIGSLWSTTNGFGVQSFALIQLYWEQVLGPVRITAGKIDAANYFNRNRAANANLFYLNQAFSGNPVRNLPSNGLGAVGRVVVGDWIFKAGFGDQNGKKTTSGFDTFGLGEYYYAAEVVLNRFEALPVADRTVVFESQYRATLIYSDATANQPAGWFFGLSFDQVIGQRFVAFFKYSINDRALGKPTHQMIALGVDGLTGFDTERSADNWGVAFAWGQPTDRSLRDQFVLEGFYRIQVTPASQLTFSLQGIIDPSENTTTDAIGVLSIRLRFVL